MNSNLCKSENHNVTYINAEQAKLIDEELMGNVIGYSVDQLMELAGLSVALAVDKTITTDWKTNSFKKILNISGPGNNGGDGLVASRYLKEFGYEVDVFYPKKTDKDLYLRLIKQCEQYSIPIKTETDNLIDSLSEYDLIIDSIFGFSFKGELRSPFNKIIKAMTDSEVKIASVDIPSGWDIEKGNVNNTFTPDLLISLTLPKLCSLDFKGIHYLGGRFVPPSLYQKLNIIFKPLYEGSEMIRLI